MYYLAKNSEGQYLCGIDENNEPIFSDSFDSSLWSWNEERLQNYVDDNSIEATVSANDSGNNNPPQKPPF
jgi:hypothetical protein